ncbi:MAG: serine hydrolase domain-containing protein, partial [Acidobacteriota bacterium]
MKQRIMLAAMVLAAAATPVPAQGTPDPDSPRWQGVQALVRLAGSRGQADLDRFLEERIAPELREKVGPGPLREQLRRLRDDLSGMELQGARPEGPFAAVARFAAPEGGELVIPFRLEEGPPHRFLQIAFIGAAEPASQEPLTWENLEARLEEEAEAGFSGAVVVVRDGKTVLDRGYGLANREKRIPNRPDTIFAIGSTPIDFTKAGILLLAQQGKLGLDDPITKYFPDVPQDKRGITLRQLMTGRSGLRNFHGRPSDPNPDHTWIDRDEAMRRIFEGELLFPPGEGRRHSHSAWGVLAAVIEIVSGQSYPEFTEEHLFGPAGMVDTGFFGEPYPEDRMAVGYGDDTSGEINAPPYWGPTSWLVMGSGGQVSTT